MTEPVLLEVVGGGASGGESGRSGHIAERHGSPVSVHILRRAVGGGHLREEPFQQVPDADARIVSDFALQPLRDLVDIDEQHPTRMGG